MDVFGYLEQYKNVVFKEKHFNEIDALLLAAISYVPFDEFDIKKNKIKANELYSVLNGFNPPSNYSERRLKYINLLKIICGSQRFGKAVFVHFKKERDAINDKQFQAICIILNHNLYISFCGTDATKLGWKEDFNMSYLEIVPSEIEAAKYANFIASKFWFKKIYLLGHSKGGRLAITAAKKLNKKKRLGGIYTFDAPNYPSSCYNNEYKEIDPFINAFTPNESIIGRLMPEYRAKKIICSTNKLLSQHDIFSWIIEGKSFVYTNAYSETSTRIVNTINRTLVNEDEETKCLFVETLFDFIERLEISSLPSKKDLLPFAVEVFQIVRKEWKNTAKEKRQIVKKIIFDLIKDYLMN